MPVKNVETPVVGAAQDLRVVVAEGDAEDAELEAWRSQGQLQVRLALVRGGRGGETDLVIAPLAAPARETSAGLRLDQALPTVDITGWLAG